MLPISSTSYPTSYSTFVEVRIVNDECLEVVYQNLIENQPDNGRVNIFIAAFTTCHARLKLYEYLQLLQQQVLYFDTDSVIYSHQPGQPDIEPGDFLGEMTDELEGEHIVEFTSAGPKNYGYITNTGKKCCKVRGFTLNVRGSQQLNYDVMRDNLLDEIQDPQDETTRRPCFWSDLQTRPQHQRNQRRSTRKTIRARL